MCTWILTLNTHTAACCVSECVGWLPFKPRAFGAAVFSYKRAERIGGETPFSRCDNGGDSSAVRKPTQYFVICCVRLFEYRVQCKISDLCAHCRFRYESNHLLDMSAEEDNELPPVKTLLEVLYMCSHSQQKKTCSSFSFWMIHL